jgi:iron(III) transport system permease protein
MTRVQHRSRESAVVPTLVVLLVLLPLLAAFGSALSPEGRDALAAWWARPNGWRMLLHTLLFAATGATVALVAGWLVALLLPASGAMRRLVMALCCLPLLVPSSLMGVGWIMAMGRDAVVTNALRHVLGDATPTIYAWPIAAAATGLRYFGVAVLVLAGARGNANPLHAVEQAFRLSRWTRLRLRIGATRTAAIVAWLLLVLLVQSDHILPGMFLVHTFGTEVLIQFTALMDPAGAAALSLVPAVIALVVMIACATILHQRGAAWSNRDDADGLCSSGMFHPRLLVIAVILLVVIAVPIAGLIIRAHSIANLRDAWGSAADAVAHSVALAASGAALTLVFALPLAHGWVAAHRARRASAAPLVLLNLAVPGSLLALGILALHPPRSFINSEAAMIFGYAARFTAIAVIVMFAAWVRQSPTANIAARVHGVPFRDRLTRLTFPARAPGAIAALTLVALLVAAELEISIILVRPGPTTLGVRLYTLIHTAPDHVVAALAVDVLIVVLLAVLSFAAVTAIARRIARRGFA